MERRVAGRKKQSAKSNEGQHDSGDQGRQSNWNSPSLCLSVTALTQSLLLIWIMDWDGIPNSRWVVRRGTRVSDRVAKSVVALMA